METELRPLLRQIEEEYDAAYRGMNAFSDGAVICQIKKSVRQIKCHVAKRFQQMTSAP